MERHGQRSPRGRLHQQGSELRGHAEPKMATDERGCCSRATFPKKNNTVSADASTMQFDAAFSMDGSMAIAAAPPVRSAQSGDWKWLVGRHGASNPLGLMPRKARSMIAFMAFSLDTR